MDSEIPQGSHVNQSGQSLRKPCRSNVVGPWLVGLWERYQPGLLGYFQKLSLEACFESLFKMVVERGKGEAGNSTAVGKLTASYIVIY